MLYDRFNFYWQNSWAFSFQIFFFFAFQVTVERCLECRRMCFIADRKPKNCNDFITSHFLSMRISCRLCTSHLIHLVLCTFQWQTAASERMHRGRKKRRLFTLAHLVDFWCSTTHFVSSRVARRVCTHFVNISIVAAAVACSSIHSPVCSVNSLLLISSNFYFGLKS